MEKQFLEVSFQTCLILGSIYCMVYLKCFQLFFTFILLKLCSYVSISQQIFYSYSPKLRDKNDIEIEM